jgi:hypothetical protein
MIRLQNIKIPYQGQVILSPAEIKVLVQSNYFYLVLPEENPI